MTKPYTIPDIWRHKDWDSLCDVCGQPLFMVAIAEKRLPVAGPCEVTRCPGCTRALFYRSTADERTVADYRVRIEARETTIYHWTPERTPAAKGLRTEKFPHVAA